MKDRNGVEIKSGYKIKHIHHSAIAAVRLVDGVLYAGSVRVDAYHSSVVEVVSTQ